MTTTCRKVAILAEGSFTVLSAKTAVGVIRYSNHEIVAVIDSTQAGKTVQDVLGFGGAIPIVSSVEDVLKFQPEVLLIGIAPTGGQLPEGSRVAVTDALNAGMHVWSGMHAFLSDNAEFARLAAEKHVEIWDVRKPRLDLYVGLAQCLKANAYILLTVGSDCNVGKMTTALELQKHAREKGFKAGFVATGQTGILIEGRGTPLDAIPGDFMSGEVERLVMELDAEGCDVIFVEGQGSLVHPGFGPVTLGLMLGAMPDGYILCHQHSRKTFRPDYDLDLPTLPVAVKHYEQLMEFHKGPKVKAVALNTFDLSAEAADQAVVETEAETGMPAADPIRHGVAKLWDAIEADVRKKRGAVVTK